MKETSSGSGFTVALISDVFWQVDGEARLRAHLTEARASGASLAVLPELPLNPWSAATTKALDEDCEQPGGPRSSLQAGLASEIGIGLVGGAILVGDDGLRRNTALVFSPDGDLLGSWEKAHIPDEPGFRESDHYARGRDVPTPIEGLEASLGVQICSDVNRPEGTHLLAAQGAQLVVAPRATELATWHRWKPVLTANALTSCCWVASVNRPEAEQDVLIGGPSFAVAPDGSILLETTDTIGLFTFDLSELPHRQREYPGYLDVRADLYSTGWGRLL
ncbi:MAG: carbon-nitrogen hydrolase family protein [Phycisphaerales bacterium]|nr:carbon-nitrogen hydrolase family protein [Phycisphaerales bacterium]